MAAVSRGDAEAALRGVSARAVPAPAKTPARVAPAKPTGTAKASPAAPAIAIGGGGGGGGGAALDSTRAPAAAADAAASREHAYLELSVGGEARGRLVAELFGDLVPRTAANFAALCAGASVAGRRLSYEGCAFHRLVRGFVLQGGDVISGDGSGAACIHDDRRLDLPHSRPGLLSMANMGRDSNGCQFFVTLQPAPQLDGKHVVFGRLVAGMALLRQLEEMPTDATERPATPIVITRCGAL
ncbi:hypothetical protein EMIHUDRAFT_68682, partial [Emiliania huxleyi CCMP1516]|uniref:Peptidyl-prolyl cis-trans isomerase n=2 Tax=Emiliania huxleyi TaxID=2903 RepID=A0A0D3I5I9_EMIH1